MVNVCKQCNGKGGENDADWNQWIVNWPWDEDFDGKKRGGGAGLIEECALTR